MLQKTLIPAAGIFACLCLFVTPELSAQTRPKESAPQPTPSVPGVDLTKEPRPSIPDNARTKSAWSFLSREAAGVETFVKSHPQGDGRGVIVVILDTGVDPAVEGLETTSIGSRKMIDVVDYSGAGDVRYQIAERRGDELYLNNKSLLKGLGSVALKSWDNTYYYGALAERRFRNGRRDLNFNGKLDDNFGVLLFEAAPNDIRAIVDADADGDLSDEIVTADFAAGGVSIALRSSDSTVDPRVLNAGVKIFPDSQKVSIVFDDGSHGTHVAGIAAGFNIAGQEGFHGVAPGAEVVGIKFADNSLGGITVTGSMQKAFEYCAKLATSQPKPVVVNVSFGIGSELEGQSAMDTWLDSLLATTPNLVVCVSASNDGPGLSNIGLPGTAERVITSAAALPDDAARDLYGFDVSQPRLWDFSSRGGELAKPDIVTPGTAVSTVPDFVGGPRYNGTSMASPYTAGCVAVLLSAMRQEFPRYVPNSFRVKRALQLSAEPMPGQTPLDEGYGMVNVPKAYELLAGWERRGTAPIEYSVRTQIPSVIGIGTAAYFRNGEYPRDGESQRFYVAAEPEPAISRSSKIGMKTYDLVSDVPWMRSVEAGVYRRGEQEMAVNVRYDTKLLQKPGLYSGRIWGYPRGVQRKKENAAFELLSSVVIPYDFRYDENYTIRLADVRLNSYAVTRNFFRITPGTKALKFTLMPRGKGGNISAVLFNNDGREFGGFSASKSNSTKPVSYVVTTDDAGLGVWELTLKQSIGGDEASGVIADLNVQAIPFEMTVSGNSSPTIATVRLTSGLAEPVNYRTEAEVLGVERNFDTMIATDTWLFPVNPGESDGSIEFKVALSREGYNQFTDISLQVLDQDSNAVVNTAYDLREHTARFYPTGSRKYYLRFQGGAAVPSQYFPLRIRVRERRFLEKSLALITEKDVQFIPGEERALDLKLEQALPPPPSAYSYFGALKLKDGTDSFMLPLRF